MDKKTNDTNLNNRDYEIPINGSLGLLALGFKGLLAWRAKRRQAGMSVSEHRYFKTDELE